MKLFHSSPSDIDTFDFSKGVHFGGYFSALQAGFRKLEQLNNKYENIQDYIYLYSFNFKEDTSYYTEDVGGYDAWLDKIKIAKKEGFDIISYTNKYEPDSSSYSYILLNSNYLTFNSKIKLKKIEVEKILQDKGY